MKIISITLLIVFILAIGIFLIRFLLGGNEDSWICVKGKWVEHGKPSSPKPEKVCKK